MQVPTSVQKEESWPCLLRHSQSSDLILAVKTVSHCAQDPSPDKTRIMASRRWLAGLNFVKATIGYVNSNPQAGRFRDHAVHESYVAVEECVKAMRLKPSIAMWTQKLWGAWMDVPLLGLLLACGFHDKGVLAENAPQNLSLISQQEIEFLGEVKKDPHAGVVGLFVLPLLSLSVGYQPNMQILAEGAASIEDCMDALDPWEIVVVLWGLARSGLSPSKTFLAKAEAALKKLDGLNVRETAAALWALCMLDCISKETWETLIGHIAAYKSRDFDEASILHILQASMLYASKSNTATPPGDLRASKADVETILSPLDWKVLRRCIDAYSEYVPCHPYLDGPYMTLSFMMQMLSRFRSSGGSHAAKVKIYDEYFEGVSKREVDWAETTLLDARKLSQLKRELFYQWRGNEIVDEWQEVVNEAVFLLTRRLGNVVTQPPDCDITLPQKRVAMFIEDDRPRPIVGSLVQASAGMLHLFGTETATPTSGFALHECYGTKLAKRRCIQERGWHVVIIPFSVWKQLGTPEAKQKALQAAIVTGGLQDGMSSLFQSAVRR